MAVKAGMKRLGILGGMGAAAGVKLAERFVSRYQQLGAVDDSDFPDFVLVSIDVGLDALGFADTEHGKLQDRVKTGLRILNAAQCEVAFIACNTVHAFFTNVSSKFRGNLLNMVSIACEKVRGKTVGVIGSETTKRLGVYERSMDLFRCRPIQTTENEQMEVNRIIGLAISGKQPCEDAAMIKRIIERMKSTGADAVILGCTELSLVIDPKSVSGVIDAGFETLEAACKLL